MNDLLRNVELQQSGDWYENRWWRVVGPDGSLWCETSDKQEAIDSMRPGDKLFHLWAREEKQWREVEVPHA